MPWSESMLLSKLKEIPREHAELFEGYRTLLLNNDSSTRNANNNIAVLILFSRFINKKDLYQVERKDIFSFIDSHKRSIEQDPEQKWIVTWNDYLSRLKGFYRWLYNKDGENDREGWETPSFIKIKRKKNKRISRYGPADVWDVDDIMFVVKCCNNNRDRALLTCMFDLAGRNHEVTKLKIKDILFKDNYAEAMISWDTKTGMRPVPLIISFPFLKIWLNEHHFNNTIDFVVFPSLTTWKPLEPDSIWTVTKSLKHKLEKMLIEGTVDDVNERKKIKELLKKPWNPYLMGRHSSLTEKANILTEFQLRKYAGWSVNSKRPATYVHLSGKEINDPLLKHYGLEKEVTKPKPIHQTCAKCGFINPLHYKLCEKCDYILNVEAFEELKQKELEKDKELGRLTARIEEMEITMGVVRPLLGQLAKETKTDGFIFTGPEGDKIGKILTKDLRKIDEETKED